MTNFEPELNLLNEKCYKVPKYTTESKEVQKACDDMNKYCQASITYPMKENVVVDKVLISTWVSADADMNVTFNEEAVRAWMRDFGKTYDTVGTTRTITSPTGKTVEVSGGTYGWSIDEEAETQNLIASIKNGEVVTREPAYEKTAASHAAQDWGTTYLEVDTFRTAYVVYCKRGDRTGDRCCYRPSRCEACDSGRCIFDSLYRTGFKINR
jgi:Putative peptidoglycan binding domain.